MKKKRGVEKKAGKGAQSTRQSSVIYKLAVLFLSALTLLIGGGFVLKMKLASVLDDGRQSPFTSQAISTDNLQDFLSPDPFAGDEDAEVVITYFYDYQCQWCRRFDRETFPKLKKEYIDRGKVRFVFKDFAFLGEDSKRLALAAECVYKKYGSEKFLEYHLWLYEKQKKKNSGWGSMKNILNFSSSLSWLNTSYLKECVESNTYLQDVKHDTYSGMMRGVSSTPTFFINGRKVSGAQPYSFFKRIIETSSPLSIKQ